MFASMKRFAHPTTFQLTLSSRILVSLYFLLWLCSATTAVQAQQDYSIRGSVADTVSFSKMCNSTVYVLRAKDSIIRQYIYVSPEGTFAIKGLAPGNYILLITYPDYVDYAEPFYLDEAHTTHDFGSINMQLKARLLQEVIVKGTVTAIKIKGDTTEFNAKAYVIQPNDKVEDLLKQLPGLQVDKDGKITANGERVTKVLLDGEEFFGDDPTLVTKNIRADMVDKIQLYDKKSDQAVFTGIDDGVRTKTINVKLKEDKNKGIFGKIETGAGSDRLYQAQGMYNHFKPGERYAAYATAANTGKVSLGQSDNSRLGTAGNIVPVGDVVIIPTTGGDELDGTDGAYNGRGLPVAGTGGIHYDAKWKNGKDIFNANYKAGYLGVNGTNNVLSQQTMPSGIQNSTTDRDFDQSAFRQKIDAAYSFNPDSSSTIKMVADGTLKSADAKTNYLTTTARGNTLLNRNTQSQNSHSNVGLFDLSALYTKKLKRGRTFSWAVTSTYNQDNTTGYQNSALDFYNSSGGKDSTTRIDQYKTTGLSIAVVSSNMTYTQPLFKSVALVFNYGIGMNNSRAERNTFNLSPSGYNERDTTYSNKYQFNQLTNQLGSILNYRYGKSVLNAGARLSFVDFKQDNLNTGNIYRRDFLRWSPQLSYVLRISQQKSFTFNYNGSTIQPTINQVQPVRVNNDPLNVILGNPGLQPAFSHRMNFRYKASSVINGYNISFGGSYGFNPDAIVNSLTTSATGKTTIQYVNLQNQTPHNYSFNSDITFRIKPLDMSAEIELNASGTRSYLYSNNVLSTSNTQEYSGTIQLRKNKQKAYNISFVAGPDYTFNNFSLQQYNGNAAGFYSDGYVMVFLPAKFQLTTTYTYNYRGATQSLEAQSRFIWNTTIAKTFLKSDALKLDFTVNDQLNQNINYNRNITANAITQSSYNGIRRNCLLTLSWDFNKFGATTEKK
jgi:hypothetical protein